MLLFVKVLDGRTRTVEVEPDDILLAVMKVLQEKEGIAVDQQRLCFQGRQLIESARLCDQKVTPCVTLHLVLRLRGMISTFDTTAADASSDLTVPFLMLKDSERANVAPPLQALRDLFVSKNARQTATFTYSENPPILRDYPLEALEDLADLLWENHAAGKTTDDARPIKDLRVNVPWDVAAAVFARSEKEMMDAFRALFRGEGSCKLAMRITHGPTEACIPFHCDGAYATHTTQIALNDDIEGGRLCFFVDGKLEFPRRVAGSMTQHPPRVLHAVTALHAGVRKSLFVLDERNGMGEKGVVSATLDDAKAFPAWSKFAQEKRNESLVKPASRCTGERVSKRPRTRASHT